LPDVCGYRREDSGFPGRIISQLDLTVGPSSETIANIGLKGLSVPGGEERMPTIAPSHVLPVREDAATSSGRPNQGQAMFLAQSTQQANQPKETLRKNHRVH